MSTPGAPKVSRTYFERRACVCKNTLAVPPSQGILQGEMRLKSFTARTAAEAMAEVRRVLGEEAVIVATREEDGGVRVTAALDEARPLPAAAPLAPPPLEPDHPDGPDVTEAVLQALERHFLPRPLLDKLTHTLQAFDLEQPVLALGAALDATFSFQPLPEGRSERPLMLVGPPGAGKTLSVAKLATRLALRGHPVSVISTDTERAGGIEQLAAFTRLLNVDLIEVEDPGALKDALTVRRDAVQVIIDTPGQNPFDPAALGQLGRLIKSLNAEAILALPAGLDATESGEMAAAFQAAGATRLLATRLDLSRRYGSLLSAAWQGGLRFCDAAASASVTSPLAPLNPLALARLLLPESESKVNAERQTGTHA